MEKNSGMKQAMVFLSAAILSACGGGGGADNSTSTVTPQQGAKSAVVAASVFDLGQGSGGAQQAQSSTRKTVAQRVLGALAPKRAASAVTAQSTTEECSGGGTYTEGDPSTKNVDSPYSTEAFTVIRSVDNDCRETETGEGYTDEFVFNGVILSGHPVSQTDETDPYIEYEEIGENGEPFSFTVTSTENYAATFEFSGLAHSRNSLMEGAFEEQIIVNFTGNVTKPEVTNYQATAGKAGSPFVWGDRWVSDGVFSIELNGPMSISIADNPECSQSEMTISTLEPIIENNDLVVDGKVQITQSGSTYTIDFQENGDMIVQANGTSQTFTAEEVDAIHAECAVETEL